MQRRAFLQSPPPAARRRSRPPAARQHKMIGIQVGAVSFVDEGVEKVLDVSSRMAPSTRSSSPPSPTAAASPAARCPASRCPITANRSTTPTPSTAAVTPRIHPRVLPRHRAHRFPRARVRRLRRARSRSALSAAKRGMKTICWFEDVWRRDVPHVEQTPRKYSSMARSPPRFCFNNPNYRNWLLGTVEDYARSYEIDGIMWGSERAGRLLQHARRSHGGNPQPRNVTCFCELLRGQSPRARHRPWPRPRRVSKRSPNSSQPRARASAPSMATTSRCGA